jgi:CRP/FNR family transcriptional regulator, anaerobic regulatory protein
MSRGDIGDFLGLRSETICRTFAHLVSTGAIAMPEPQRVRLLDPAALRTMAGWS